MSQSNEFENAFSALSSQSQDASGEAAGELPWTNVPRNHGESGAHAPFAISIVRADGGQARNIPVTMGDILLDEDAEIIAPADTSAQSHACLKISSHDDDIFIEDLGNDGLFRRVFGKEELLLPSELRFGSHRCLLEELEPPEEKPLEGFWGAPRGMARARLSDLLDGGIVGDTFILRENAPNQVGRERGDIVFHPTDNFISSNHARFEIEGSQVSLRDLSSSNGTFIRVHGMYPVSQGAQFLMGHYLIKFSIPGK
jgi:FOG: FHA domain